ncbi:MAG: ABC transporter ATP-binding protein [Spirochaetota bacterium]
MTKDNQLIEVRGLCKSYGEVRAVDGIDFAVAEGELFGFLGPNGAGKTTTIDVLTGLGRSDSGTVRIGGIDCSRNPKAAQHLMGIVPDESNLYPELSGRDNLEFCGSLYGMPAKEREARAGELLDRFGLEYAAGRRFGGYSKGMKRKLTIAAGIVHSPPLLFLDEPTTGIDVASARDIRRLLAELNGAGTTVFLTTHYIEEAERLCDRIAFIVGGRIVRTDTVDVLIEDARHLHVVHITVDARADELASTISSRFDGVACVPESDREIRIESSAPVSVGPIIRMIEEHGVEVYEARRLRPSLEEVFVRITGIESKMMNQEKERQQPGGGA